MTQLDRAVDTALDAGKYCIIFDKTHNAEVFFRYKAHLIEVNKVSIGITVGKQTKEEGLETLRKGLIYTMRSGDKLVYYIGNISPDFKSGLTGDDSTFPTEKIFNFAEWRKEENYKKIVREEEDHDLMGNKKCYWMNDKFTMVILAEDEGDEEAKKEVLSKIPHLENFEIITIE